MEKAKSQLDALETELRKRVSIINPDEIVAHIQTQALPSDYQLELAFDAETQTIELSASQSALEILRDFFGRLAAEDFDIEHIPPLTKNEGFLKVIVKRENKSK